MCGVRNYNWSLQDPEYATKLTCSPGVISSKCPVISTQTRYRQAIEESFESYCRKPNLQIIHQSSGDIAFGHVHFIPGRAPVPSIAVQNALNRHRWRHCGLVNEWVRSRCPPVSHEPWHGYNKCEMSRHMQTRSAKPARGMPKFHLPNRFRTAISCPFSWALWGNRMWTFPFPVGRASSAGSFDISLVFPTCPQFCTLSTFWKRFCNVNI